MGIRILSVALALTLGVRAHAATCDKEARAAKAAGIAHVVVSFEGLASYAAGFVRKGLIAPLSSRHPGAFVSANFSYTSSRKAGACIRDWKKVHGVGLKVSVIGHSFGGGIAVPKFLAAIPEIEVETVVTLDPRSWTADFKASRSRSLEQFAKAANVKRHVNFYQRGGMPGYLVKGAENFQVEGVSHTRLPRHPMVIDAVDEILF